MNPILDRGIHFIVGLQTSAVWLGVEKLGSILALMDDPILFFEVRSCKSLKESR